MRRLKEVALQILDELALLPDTPDLKQPAAQHLFDLHKEYLQLAWPQGLYSPAAHRGLAAMYVSDDRFKKYYAKGTGKEHAAETLKAVIDYYA